MRRKRPLKESLDENTGPISKRVRLEEAPPTENFVIPVTRRNRQRNQRTRLRRRQIEEGQLFEGTNTSKRGKRSSANQETTPPTDENDISELTRQFKRARLRPVLFTISTFIEQTVGDIQITVGDDGQDETNDEDYGEASATFTFRLPHPPQSQQRPDYIYAGSTETSFLLQSRNQGNEASNHN